MWKRHVVWTNDADQFLDIGRRIRIKVFKIHGQVQRRISPAVPICL